MRKPMHYAASPKLFENAKSLREHRTPAEIKLWEALRDRQIDGFKFRQQHPISVYVLDFYCHAALLGIELDGDYHYTEEQIELDNQRTANLETEDLRIIRFSNHAILHDFENVIADIRFALQETPFPILKK